jgi:hypothetical protein
MFVRQSGSKPTRGFRVLSVFIAALLIQLSLPIASVTAADATLGGGANVAYTENDPATLIGANLTVGGGPYDGKHIEFAIGSQVATDILSLQKVQTAVITNGTVSVVGSQVYVGDGTVAKPFASIDEVKNGTNGQPLRINFSSAFGNSGFENATVGEITKDNGNTSLPSLSTQLAGWTIVGLGNQDHYLDLGTTDFGNFSINNSNNFVPSDNDNNYTAGYASNPPNRDNNKPRSANFRAEITNSTKSEGSKSLRLFSNGMTTTQGCDVVHGPAAVSDPFDAAQNDVISFDWSAANGGDDYDAYGFIVNTATGAQTEVIDANGTSQVWVTKNTTIPATGTYRFVFVNGTHDRTCGLAAGGSLYIDNIRVVGSLATATNVERLARLVTYNSTSNNPDATRVVTFTAVPATGNTASTSFNINITRVNDAPTLADQTLRLHDTADADTFPTQSGTFAATDPDDTTLTYHIMDGANRVTLTDGVGTLADTYGSLSLNSTTGAYTYTPNAVAINGVLANKTDSFDILVEDAGGNEVPQRLLTDTATLTINILYETVFVNVPAPIAVDKGTTTAYPGFSLGGTAPSNTTDYLLTIELISAPTGTTGRITASQSVTAAEGYANAFNSFTMISFIGTPSEINTALASFTVVAGNTAGTLSVKVTATKYLINSAFFNGNYYISVTGNISWSNAATAAKQTSYLGLTGYLVTITSQAEQDFIASKIPNAQNIWIGATDAASEGAWRWESGTASPDAGKQFWQGAANGSRFTGAGLNYDNWCVGTEPNNAGSAEHYAVTNWGGRPCWNDLPDSFGSVQGYVIEYGNNQPITNNNDTDTETTTVTVNTSGAPTNSSVAASALTATTATLNSNVNANGATTTNRFCLSTSNTLNNCATTDSAAVTTIVPTTNPTLSGRVTTAVSADLTGLTPNTAYYFQSYSTNADGGPVYGAKRTFTTLLAPAPGKPVATPSNGSANIVVEPPNGATPVSYTVTSDPGGFTCTVTGAAGSCQVTGLTNGQSYTFTSIANYGGYSSAISVASDPVTPFRPIPPRPAQTDVVRPPSIPANPFAPTNRVEGNFTRPITNVTLNGLPIDPTNWRQSPTQFELETRSLRPGRYEVVINNGAATPLTYTFEKPQPTQVVPVILPTPPQPSLTPVVLEGNKEVKVVTTTKTNNAGINVKSDLWELDLSAQSQNQLNPPVVRNNLFTLPRELQIKSAGTGFMPFSLAKIFIFSEPTFVGEVEVKEDGTFETLNDLPEGIELGEHTLQVVGVSPQNTLRSTSLKILVIDAPDQVTIGFNRLQRTVADSYTIPLTSIFDKPVKKIVLEAYSKPTESKSDRKFAARRAVAATEAIRAIDKSIPIRVKNKGGKISPLCQEFKNRCVVVVVRR